MTPVKCVVSVFVEISIWRKVLVGDFPFASVFDEYQGGSQFSPNAFVLKQF